MKTKTTTSRKAQTAAAKSATKTTTDATTSRWELEHPTGVNDDQRKKRAARFKEYAEQYVAALRDDERAILDEAARNVGTTAVDFISSKLIEERGLGSRRDEDAMYYRWADDLYETGTSRSRNDHEKQEVRSAITFFCQFGPAGLTTDEKVEIVRRYFRKGDRNLDVATGRAIKDALALPSPDRMTRAEIEIEAAARIVGLTADQFIADALHTAINSAKDLNGGELDLTADERAALDAMNAR